MAYNAIEETYDPVTLFNKPALFTVLRIDRNTVPEGLFAYDIRHSDDDGNAVTVEKSVRVKHMGTVVFSEPLDFGEAEYLPLNDENGGLNFDCGHDCRTVAEYIRCINSKEDFKSRVDRDYAAFCKKIEGWSARAIIEHADEISAMKEIYAALIEPEDHFSPEEIACLSQTPRPLDSVYGYWESLTLSYRECSPYLAARAMLDDMAFDDDDARGDHHDAWKKSAPAKAVFLRKTSGIQELQDYAGHQDERRQLQVIKTIVLSSAMYDIFRENLLFDWGFSRENANLAYDGHVWNCALIRTTDRKEAICVSPEGHDYARYAAYIADHSALNLSDVPVEHRSPESEVADIMRFVNQDQDSLAVTQTQKLLCGIGKILEKAGGEQDQYYLFSHNMGSFAGFCGDSIGVNDIHEEPLYVGDMTCLNGNPDQPQLVFRHPTGEPFPSQEYVKEAGVTRLAGWQESMMFLRARDFDMLSCRGDYRMSRQIASRIHAINQEQRRSGR